MRERLLLVFGGLIMVIIVLYGTPRAYYLADDVQRAEAQQLQRSADWLQALIPERARTDGVDDEYLASVAEDDERIEYNDSAGDLIASTGERVEDDGENLSFTRQLPGGEELTVSRSQDVIQERLVSTLMPIVVIGLVLSLVAGAVCLVMARRLSRPFQELAGTARELGSGRFDIADHDYKLPEAQAIGTALRQSGLQLKELLDREREFAANASHQLRTPITALRLELEDLTYWPETAPEVTAELNHALGELDRLSSAVTELLDLARGHRVGEARMLHLDDLLHRCAKRWARLAKERGREVQVQAPVELAAAIHEGPVAQVLDVLIENALIHGQGDVVLSAEHAGSYLQLGVQDNGPRPEGDDLFERRTTQGAGEGIGLAVAAELAIAAGGSLRLDAAASTLFVLILPLDARTEVGPRRTRTHME